MQVSTALYKPINREICSAWLIDTLPIYKSQTCFEEVVKGEQAVYMAFIHTLKKQMQECNCPPKDGIASSLLYLEPHWHCD